MIEKKAKVYIDGKEMKLAGKKREHVKSWRDFINSLRAQSNAPLPAKKRGGR